MAADPASRRMAAVAAVMAASATVPPEMDFEDSFALREDILVIDDRHSAPFIVKAAPPVERRAAIAADVRRRHQPPPAGDGTTRRREREAREAAFRADLYARHAAEAAERRLKGDA